MVCVSITEGINGTPPGIAKASGSITNEFLYDDENCIALVFSLFKLNRRAVNAPTMGANNANNIETGAAVNTVLFAWAICGATDATTRNSTTAVDGTVRAPSRCTTMLMRSLSLLNFCTTNASNSGTAISQINALTKGFASIRVCACPPMIAFINTGKSIIWARSK